MLLLKFHNMKDECMLEQVWFASLSVVAMPMLCDYVYGVLDASPNGAFTAEAWYDGQMIAHFPDFIADLFGGHNEALRDYLQTRKRQASN